MKRRKRWLKFFLFIIILFAAVTGLSEHFPAVRTCLTLVYQMVSEYVRPDQNDLIQMEGDISPVNEDNTIQMEDDGSLINEYDLTSLDDSGITGDTYSVDTEMYIYYTFLSESEQNVYRQACANIEALETTFVPETDITVSETKNALNAVFNDHPEYFWIQTACSYRYTSDERCVQITILFNDTADDFSAAKAAFDSAADAIINTASALESDYEKEKYVHNAILSLTDYDESVESTYSQSAYSALVLGKSVCAGYSRAFQYIMQKLGIATYFCVGYAEGDHAWNIVVLSDGCYNVDLTWDDAAPSIYAYFNQPDSVFGTTHTRTDLSVSLPACEATGYYNLETTETIEAPENGQPQNLPQENGQPQNLPQENGQPQNLPQENEQPQNGQPQGQ